MRPEGTGTYPIKRIPKLRIGVVFTLYQVMQIDPETYLDTSDRKLRYRACAQVM